MEIFFGLVIAMIIWLIWKRKSHSLIKTYLFLSPKEKQIIYESSSMVILSESIMISKSTKVRSLHEKFVFDLIKDNDLISEEYDLYDWSSCILEFHSYTIQVTRYDKTIKIIYSSEPISIAEFKKIIQLDKVEDDLKKI